MGKKQHQKDKLYLTTTEWRETFGGCKDDAILRAQQAKFKRLPFDSCCISLQPFDFPMCSTEGYIFDITNIIPFVKKYGKNPVTGAKLEAKDLFQLNFHKNAEGVYHCPATYRVFTNTSHIVAIRKSGNVYSYEAVEELNLKTKNFRDLLTDETFIRSDIITIQDPHNLEKFNIANFYHVKKKLKIKKEGDEDDRSDGSLIKRMNTETRETLAQLKTDYKPKEQATSVKAKADSVNAAHFSTGAVAAGFTSTVMEPITLHEAAIVDEDELRYERVHKKGYVRLVTSLGDLNFELHCELTPRACDNFIRHCRSGYYRQTKFHRSIRNFMIQGGDPTGTGTGGVSAFGKPFIDEFKPQLSHEGRGILAMANIGTNTNTSQFYITFRSCKHLDRKHTVFGKLVGGFDTLNALEYVSVDDKDKPTADIMIMDTQVFVDPFEEADEMLKKEREKATKNLQEKEKRETASKQKEKPTVFKSGVGKYVNPDLINQIKSQQSLNEEPANKKAKTSTSLGQMKNFANW